MNLIFVLCCRHYTLLSHVKVKKSLSSKYYLSYLKHGPTLTGKLFLFSWKTQYTPDSLIVIEYSLSNLSWAGRIIISLFFSHEFSPFLDCALPHSLYKYRALCEQKSTYRYWLYSCMKVTSSLYSYSNHFCDLVLIWDRTWYFFNFSRWRTSRYFGRSILSLIMSYTRVTFLCKTTLWDMSENPWRFLSK